MLDPTSFFASIADVTSPLAETVFPWVKDRIKENPELRNKLAWIASVVVLILLSALFIFAGNALWGSYKPGIVISVFLWSVFLGGTAFVLLPNKLLVTSFGALLGMSLSEIPSGAGLISAARKGVTSLASEINLITAAQPGTADPFISWMVWMFVLIAGMICLPAFFQSDEQKKAVMAELKKPADEKPDEKPPAP